MVSTRSKKSQQPTKAKSIPNSAKAEKASADKKKSKAKQVKKEIKVEKKKEKAAAKKDQKRQTPPQLVKETKKEKAKPKAAKSAPQILGYTPDQYTKYKQLISEYKEKTNDELKSILRKNEQKVSGTKDELAERIADGVVLGGIPKCPSCGGGRPKFDYKKGTYYCAGYRDDVDFVNCHKSYSLSDLPRNSWIL